MKVGKELLKEEDLLGRLVAVSAKKKSVYTKYLPVK